jgi:hypothetical protein
MSREFYVCPRGVEIQNASVMRHVPKEKHKQMMDQKGLKKMMMSPGLWVKV